MEFTNQKIYTAIMLAISLPLAASVIAIASDSKPLAEINKPFRIAIPHNVTMEEWTEIVRSLRKEMEKPRTTPKKPFRFKLNRKQNNVMDL